jgi:hypothetical protein
MTQKLKATRRAVLAAAGASAAAPALAAIPAFAAKDARPYETVISRLWSRAVALERQLKPFAAEIAVKEQDAGLPGWMRLTGVANDLGNLRYDTLVSILKSQPQSIDDLATIAQVTKEKEISRGPITWARFQFDAAARDFHLAA